jgi:hypothetical protein
VELQEANEGPGLVGNVRRLRAALVVKEGRGLEPIS